MDLVEVLLVTRIQRSKAHPLLQETWVWRSVPERDVLNLSNLL